MPFGAQPVYLCDVACTGFAVLSEDTAICVKVLKGCRTLTDAQSLISIALLQVFATVIAAFGFNGYDYPDEPHNNSFNNCEFCRYAYKTTAGGYPAFYGRKVPQARTENEYIDSTIGCT